MLEDRTPCRPIWDDAISHRLQKNGAFVIQTTHIHHYRSRWHCHVGIEVLLCIQGEGVFFLDDKRISYTSGDVIIFDPQTSHRVQVKGTYRRYSMCYLPAFFAKNPATHIDIPGLTSVYPAAGEAYSLALQPTDLKTLNQLMISIQDELLARRTGYETIVNLRVAEFFALIGRIKEEQAIKETTTDKVSGKDPMAYLLAYIDANLAKELSVSYMSKLVHYSASLLYRLFIERTGLSPSSYVRSRRVSKAKSLLANSTLAVNEIATSIGFANAAHFSKVFRNETGYTPTQYRQVAAPKQHVTKHLGSDAQPEDIPKSHIS